ncbi:MAG: ParB/RepB/Spo0J family partition protein, partial [bacterium]|nr:ParB/RepB/Spo0J family partition protein [bacterium]
MNIDSSKIIEIDIDDILPNRFQPRIQFDEDEILELSDSIRKHGIIQPIVVRHIGDKYEIIVGERRYKASVLAGLETIPAIIKELDDKQSAELALIENLQRKSLTPIEEALSYKKVLDLGNLTQEGLAEKIGKSQSSVANKIRLLSLSDEVQDALLDNKISERHARSLLKLKSILDQNSMLDKIINERMTVRKTDEEIEKIIENKKEKSVPDIHKKEGEEKMNNESNENLKVNDFSQLNFGGSAESNQFLSPAPSPVENSFDIFADDMLKEQGTVSSSTVPEPPQMPTFGVELPQAPIAPEQPQMPTFGV